MAQAIDRLSERTAGRLRRRARAFLQALVRQSMPVVLLDADEVRLGCDLAHLGYVQAERGGAGREPSLVVCAVTPWGRCRIARRR